MDIESRFWIRVLLLDDIQSCTLKTLSSFEVLDLRTGTRLAKLRRLKKPAKLTVSAGKISLAGKTFAAEKIVIMPAKPHVFSFNDADYRGKLVVQLSEDGNSFQAINYVPLEPYLAGVISAEMPSYWEMAALKAQTIAARTYCLYIKKKFGSSRSWDVSKTQAHQVYRGLAAETKRIRQAINLTKGQVLICKLTDGTRNIFPTFYSSSCGGHTENSVNVFGGDSFEPLAGVPCPHCKAITRPSVFSWPMARIDKKTATEKLLKRYPKLKPLGEIETLSSARQSKYKDFSRTTLVKLLGKKGKDMFLRAEDLRLTLDPGGRKIKSTACKIISMGDDFAFVSGRGFGHGVGMCQNGAQGLARKGKDSREILFYYYPNSEIVPVY